MRFEIFLAPNTPNTTTGGSSRTRSGSPGPPSDPLLGPLGRRPAPRTPSPPALDPSGALRSPPEPSGALRSPPEPSDPRPLPGGAGPPDPPGGPRRPVPRSFLSDPSWTPGVTRRRPARLAKLSVTFPSSPQLSPDSPRRCVMQRKRLIIRKEIRTLRSELHSYSARENYSHGRALRKQRFGGHTPFLSVS